MQRLYDSLWKLPIQTPSDIETHQYLFELLNILTLKLLEIHIPPHRNSRLSKCRCALCRYQQLCEVLTQPPFPHELTLPRRTPNFALKYLPKCVYSLNISHTLLTQFLIPKRFDYLVALNISATSIATNCIDDIAALPHLKSLNISECRIKDSIMTQLKDVPLDSLICTNNNLTNNTLTQLQNTPLGNALKYFDISNNQIKSSSLNTILKYPELVIFIVKGTQIDQRSLKTFVSRHEQFKYNGMQLERIGRKFSQKQFDPINEQWGLKHFCEALCVVGCTSFNQEQTNAKTSTESIIFTAQQ
ncbi:hypothetical protein ENUP19_0013G0006 [Entamoeba nuttalli]|uniref:Leucine-rich repeat containing protein n=2 Tax=Entamoeba nuttalli TaxID=412467 RepID=K2H180_ENTNP|nr:hypothetical protein ENU1_061130 [Entamoeba nuttalli P19]EKE41293.1 hypothetical protein ENU1_061130 [Entamoeba nuttalli P19]|eukprot:XP_008856376.1 hypothetical protein ENU1_061130 [Entamoeba nuttalli P19]